VRRTFIPDTVQRECKQSGQRWFDRRSLERSRLCSAPLCTSCLVLCCARDNA